MKTPADRSRTRRLRDLTALVWLSAAVGVSLVHRWVPASTWLMIHLVLLGALTHSALVWSEHFAHTLLRLDATDAVRRRQNARVLLLAAGSLAVFAGVPSGLWWLVVTGATAVAAAVVWHAVHLLVALRRALPARFRVVTHYYLAAAACLPVGATFGVLLAQDWPDPWHGRFVAAHVAANLLGWIGLTVTGTLVTFWPTMLRTRMDDRAEALARRALPGFGLGITLVVVGAGAGEVWVARAGLAAYLVALAWWGRALWRPLRVKGLREFAPASVAASLVWAAGGLVWLGALLVDGEVWARVADAAPLLGGVFALGFGVQLLAGALSYLLPSVMGGGPSVVRAGQAWLNRWATWRLAVVNGGLLLFLLPAPSWVKVTVSLLVVAAAAVFLPLLVLGARASARRRGLLALDQVAPRSAAGTRARTAPAEAERPVWSVGQLIGAVAALLLAVSVGVGVDPQAAGLPLSGASGAGPAASSAPVEPTGRTTRVEVRAVGMRFVPDRIEVPQGDRLVVVLTNDDPTTVHDLVVGSTRTPRLAAGATAELDAGVITTSVQGWCSVAGHRQMGMVLDVVVAGHGSGEGSSDSTGEGHGAAPGGADAGGAVPGADAGADSGAASGTRAPVHADPDATLSATVDPVLPPLGEATTHRITLTVTEVPLEVAPGVWQTRWTFNGGSVGPTLHGRVGDRFEVTLVNDGTIGHSIDFHAGALAPDRPMRTIAPGETLTYGFTAERAGVWMYHCSTMPMSAHIAAGMHGAVVIEPPGLEPVDHDYVLVQSEVFLTGPAPTAAAASEVDVDRVSAERPDFVVFNGVANQYDQAPLTARVGERVRFWVLAAGPNRPSAFHVVGGQFDTVWTEGTWLLRRGEGAFGTTDGGAQVLPLLPAQGGFVELTFGEAGRYPVVNHVMVDAERGAHAFLDVEPGPVG